MNTVHKISQDILERASKMTIAPPPTAFIQPQQQIVSHSIEENKNSIMDRIKLVLQNKNCILLGLLILIIIAILIFKKDKSTPRQNIIYF
jgi:hypothetical protein